MEISRAAVARFVARVRAKEGSGQALADALAPVTGGSLSRSTVDFWASGRNDPPAWLLFYMARHWKVSLDECAMDEEDRRALLDQIKELRQREAIIVSYVNRMLQSQGARPIDFGREATGS